MLRAGYRTTARLFRNSDTEVGIRWYRCAPDAPVLGYPSQLRPLLWQSHPYQYTDKGEVFNAPAEFRAFKQIPGANGQDPCGTREDFESGGLYDPDAPPAEYTAEGLSLCCGVPPGGLLLGGEFTAAGGLVWNGGAIMRLVNTVPTCFEPGAAHLNPDGVPTSVKLHAAYALNSRLYAVVRDPGPATNYRLNYFGTQPGTVAVFTHSTTVVCGFDALLYFGPANVPFELDFVRRTDRPIAISVMTTPLSTLPVVLTLTPLP